MTHIDIFPLVFPDFAVTYYLNWISTNGWNYKCRLAICSKARSIWKYVKDVSILSVDRRRITARTGGMNEHKTNQCNTIMR